MGYRPSLPGQQVIFRPPLVPVRRRRRGMSGLGYDCSLGPPLMSNYQAGAVPCQLGQGAATEACLTAQDNREQQFFADQAAFSSQCGGAAGVVSGSIAQNQIIGQGPTVETGQQAAAAIYGGVVPAGTFQTSTPTGTIPTTVQPAPKPTPVTPPAANPPASSSTPPASNYQQSTPAQTVQTAPPVGSSATLPTVSPTSCIALFGASDTCVGPVGILTALAGVAAAGLLFAFMSGGHHR